MARRENSEATAWDFYENLTGEQYQEMGLIEIMVAYADWLNHAPTVPLQDRKEAFIESVRPFVEDMGKNNANDFCKYWLQIVPGGRKYKFEKEKTWDVKLRINTWMRNVRKHSIVNMVSGKLRND